MAENHLRVDLGYGEIGLWKELFHNELDSSAGGFNSLLRSYRDPYATDVVDTVSDQFSSLSLLRRKPRTIPPLSSSLQSYRPQGPKADQRLYVGSSNLSLGITDPFYEFHLSRLRKNESQQDIRAMVLQRQESRFQGGLVHRNGNVLKESVGTGVFHPLHLHHRQTYKTASSLKKRNQRNRNQSELLIKERRGAMATTRQQQQDECYYHLPSDMDFSKDWTF